MSDEQTKNTGIICPGCGIEMSPGSSVKAHCVDGCGSWIYNPEEEGTEDA